MIGIKPVACSEKHKQLSTWQNQLLQICASGVEESGAKWRVTSTKDFCPRLIIGVPFVNTESGEKLY
jgi:hypothetical protein